MQNSHFINGFFLKDILKEKPNDIPVLLQTLMFLSVVIVSILSYILPYNYVNVIVNSHYDEISEKTMQGVSQKFSNLEQAQDTLVRMLQHSDVTESFGDYNNYFRDISSLRFFREILFVRKQEDGQAIDVHILLKSVTDGKEAEYLENTITEEYFSQLVNNEEISRGNSILLNTDASSSGTKINNLLLVRAINAADLRQGFVIALFDFEDVFGINWFRMNRQIARFSIRSLSTGRNLYYFSRSLPGNNFVFQTSQTYDFDIGEQKVEVKADFLKDDKLYLLELAPVLFALFGTVITGVIVFYLSYNMRESAHRRAIHKALEEKENELSKEMGQREQLIIALGKAEQDNRAIINSVSDIIFEIDSDGHIVFLNEQWRNITGFDTQKSLGLDLFGFIQPSDQQAARNDFRKLYTGVNDRFRQHTRLRLSDDRYRSVELSISAISQEKEGRKRIIGTFIDIEDRRRAERALGEAEKKYRAIVENAAGGIFQLTPAGMYLSVNRSMARILGYETPEAILRGIRNAHKKVYVNQRERQKFLKELEVRGSLSNYETQVYRNDGSIIWVNENVRVVRDDSGKTLYYEGSMEDITQRKEADTSLREAKIKSDMANRAKSEFLANMSHELRTPLNAIIGFSEIIKTQAFGPIQPPNYLEYANDIHRSGTTLLQIINEILDISKIEAGERSLNESIVDVEDVVEACLSLVNNKKEETGVTITNALHDVPKIIAEEVAVKQIILNLLSNAVKFTPSGGRVTLSSEKDDRGRLHFSISDTGIGLDEAEIQKALSPFGQIQNELSRTNSGTGLGLTLVDALVKLHGGELEIFSQKGIGTTVTVIFPANRLTIHKSV